MDKSITLQHYIKKPEVIDRIKELLKNRSSEFITSISSMVMQSKQLAKCEPKSLVLSALTAAAMNLPINQNLGFAYIIPYNDRKTGQTLAQLQFGYKGFIQLAQRSGQFQTINVTDVREGEIQETNRLTGEIIFDWKENRDKLPVIGYVGYMKLVNGFEKSLYMTVKELQAHGNKYSQSARKGYGLWNDDFHAMASKTVIKLLLSKYAPLTTQMQTAQLADQAVIKEDGFEYPDNEKLLPDEVAADKEREKIRKHIENAKTAAELQQCEEYIIDKEIRDLYESEMIDFMAEDAEKESK